jgi:hypothetical protein
MSEMATSLERPGRIASNRLLPLTGVAPDGRWSDHELAAGERWPLGVNNQVHPPKHRIEMEGDIAHPFIARAIDEVSLELGCPIRSIAKVARNVRPDLSIV